MNFLNLELSSSELRGEPWPPAGMKFNDDAAMASYLKAASPNVAYELIQLVRRQEQALATERARSVSNQERYEALAQELAAAKSAQPAQQPAPVAMPEGWEIHRIGDTIRVNHEAVGRVFLTRTCKDPSDVVLYHLAETLLAAPVAAPVAGQEPVDIGRLAELHFYQPDAASMAIRLHRFAMALQAAFASRAAPIPAASVQPEIERKLALNQVQIDGLHHEAERYKKLYQDLKRKTDIGRDAALVRASRSILEACETGAAPFKVEYALDKLKEGKLRVDLDPDLLLALFSALAAHPANVAQPVIDAALVAAVERIREAVSVNDGDTLSSIAKDTDVIWTASGSWSPDAVVTMGDLRAISYCTAASVEEEKKQQSDAYSRHEKIFGAPHPLAKVAQVGELSDEQIIDIAVTTRSAEANKDGGYMLPISFARAIIAAMSVPAKTDKGQG